jgi:hypothetical protein
MSAFPPASNAERIAELQEQRDCGNDYGLHEALQLALLTGVPVAAPGFGARGRLPVPAIGRPRYDDDGRQVFDWATCGTCGLAWNDALITSITPAPSARCPFEYDHDGI